MKICQQQRSKCIRNRENKTTVNGIKREMNDSIFKSPDVRNYLLYDNTRTRMLHINFIYTVLRNWFARVSVCACARVCACVCEYDLFLLFRFLRR